MLLGVGGEGARVGGSGGGWEAGGGGGVESCLHPICPLINIEVDKHSATTDRGI